MPNYYTLADKLKAIQYFDEGMKLKDVALEFHTSSTLIRDWIKKRDVLTKKLHNGEELAKIDIKSGKKSIENKLSAIEMYEKGICIGDVAKKFSTSSSVIRYWIGKKDSLLKKLSNDNDLENMEIQSGELTIENKLKAVEMYENGNKYVNIASKIGSSSSVISIWNKNKSKLMKQLSDIEEVQRTKTEYEKISLEDKLEGVRMYENGIKTSVIATKFDVKSCRIRSWRRNKENMLKKLTNKENLDAIEIEEEKYSTENKLRAIKMSEDGIPLRKIALKFGTCHATIIYWIDNKDKFTKKLSNNEELAKVEIEVGKVSIDNKIKAVDMYENGIPIKDIASKFHTSSSLILYWIRNKMNLYKVSQNKNSH